MGLARAPVQKRGKAMVERIIAAAQHMLADQKAPPTLRALAERAGVSLGTVYQYFDSMEAVRDEVGRRAAAIVRETLDQHVPPRLAADPERYFAALIASLDAVQHAHPELGCMVRAAPRSAFVEALALQLRGIVQAHVAQGFAGQPAPAGGLSPETRLAMALTSMIALLAQAPERDHADRALYLARVSRVAAGLILA